MSWRSRLGLDLAPVLLRIALGAVFIHAGAGKLFYTMPVSGVSASKLVGMGLAEAKAPATGSRGLAPSVLGPGEVLGPGPSEEPGPAPDADDTAEPTGPENLPPPTKLGHRDPADWGNKPDVTVVLPPDQQIDPEVIGELSVSRRLWLVLVMDGAAQRGQWPSALATPDALNALAWAAALTEFIGGWLVLIGLMTRIWALGLASTMVVALWLTQIGPAMAMDSGAFLGFLPPMEMEDPSRWTSAWQTMFFQLTLACAAGALALVGAGWVSLDGLLFGGAGRHVAGTSRTGSRHTDTMRV